MARVFTRERTWLDPVLRPLERLIYRLTGVDETREMRWTEYAVALLIFSVVSMLVLYAMQRLQAVLPFNPQGFGAGRARPRLQHGRVVHDQHELAGLRRRVDHELPHADGRARLPQLRLGGGRHRRRDRVHPRHRAAGEGHASATSGSTWCARRCGCCCRSAIVGALFLVSQGVVQNLQDRTIDRCETDSSRRPRPQQTIAQGPVASQEVIKQFGTNGGGFFNANSAHPFENPTPLSNFFAMFGIFAISAGAHLHARRR